MWFWWYRSAGDVRVAAEATGSADCGAGSDWVVADLTAAVSRDHRVAGGELASHFLESICEYFGTYIRVIFY